MLRAIDVEKAFDKGDVQIDYMPFDAEVKRTEGTIRHSDGKVTKYTKGASAVILRLIGDEALTRTGRCRREQAWSTSGSEPSPGLAPTPTVGGRWLAYCPSWTHPAWTAKDTFEAGARISFGIDEKMTPGDPIA